MIVLTLTKEHENMGIPSHMWNFVSPRNSFLLRGNEPEPENNPPTSSEPTSKLTTAGASLMETMENLITGKKTGKTLIDGGVVTSNNFSNWTQGNKVDVLIDGLETFERMFEVHLLDWRLFGILKIAIVVKCMMLAQHSISILAWEVSLSFGLILVQRAKIPVPPLTLPSAKWVSLEVRNTCGLATLVLSRSTKFLLGCTAFAGHCWRPSSYYCMETRTCFTCKSITLPW